MGPSQLGVLPTTRRVSRRDGPDPREVSSGVALAPATNARRPARPRWRSQMPASAAGRPPGKRRFETAPRVSARRPAYMPAANASSGGRARDRRQRVKPLMGSGAVAPPSAADIVPPPPGPTGRARIRPHALDHQRPAPLDRCRRGSRRAPPAPSYFQGGGRRSQQLVPDHAHWNTSDRDRSLNRAPLPASLRRRPRGRWFDLLSLSSPANRQHQSPRAMPAHFAASRPVRVATACIAPSPAHSSRMSRIPRRAAVTTTAPASMSRSDPPFASPMVTNQTGQLADSKHHTRWGGGWPSHLDLGASRLLHDAPGRAGGAGLHRDQPRGSIQARYTISLPPSPSCTSI